MPRARAVRIAAEVDGFDADRRFGRRRARHLDRVVQLALVATKEAIEASKLDVATAPERTGVVYASGIGGIRTLEDGIRTLIGRGPEWVNPYVVPMMIPNMAGGRDSHGVAATGLQLLHGDGVLGFGPRHRDGVRRDPPRPG